MFVRRDGHVETDPAEGVAVVATVGEAEILKPFDALTELAAHAQPRGQLLIGAVEYRNLLRDLWGCGGRRGWRHLRLCRCRCLLRLLRDSGERNDEQRDRRQPERADEQRSVHVDLSSAARGV